MAQQSESELASEWELAQEWEEVLKSALGWDAAWVLDGALESAPALAQAWQLEAQALAQVWARA